MEDLFLSTDNTNVLWWFSPDSLLRLKINQLSVLLPGHIGDLLNCRIPHEVSSGDTTAHTSQHNLPDTDNSFNNNKQQSFGCEKMKSKCHYIQSSRVVLKKVKGNNKNCLCDRGEVKHHSILKYIP